MKATRLLTVFIMVLLTVTTQASGGVKIVSAVGDVKIRRGIEENWHPASAGAELEEIDSILTGETGRVVLQINNGSSFKLGGNSILDIADLRKISERELFLILMSEKINSIEPREEKTKLRIGNVNVVHGERKTGEANDATAENSLWVFEKNGAQALLEQNYVTNAVLKFNKILTKYERIADCGEIHFYLGQGFERLKKPGQAIDAYQEAVKRNAREGCQSKKPPWMNEAESALQRLNR